MAQAQAVALNELIETLKDCEHGYAEAAETASRPDLKKFFLDLSFERSSFASALETIVEEAGEAPEENGTVAGTLRRGWMTLSAAFSSKGDLTVLEECEREETTAIEKFAEALSGRLPATARRLVERQHEKVQAALTRIRMLRDVAHMSATAR